MAKIIYAENGKRDLHNLEGEFLNAFKRLEKEEKWKYDNNRLIVINYIKDCKKGLAKSGNANVRVGMATLYRIMGILRLLSEDWIRKDFDTTTQKDWDKFYDRMEENKLMNAYGKKYKPSTKSKNYKTIRKFLKWKFGNNRTYPSYCDNWATTEEKPSRYALTRQQVEKMINGCSTLRMKFRQMVLFDGGFRVEEYANLRWADLQKPEGKDYYRAFIKAETSKTKKERWVSLLLSTDFIDSYKNSQLEKLKGKLSEDDYIDVTSYNKIYKSIKRVGKKILNLDVTPHILRHSSASYYANVIRTYPQFCARYGWSLKSSTAQRYFHRVVDEEIAEQTKDHEIARFKTEFERSRMENKILQVEVEKMKRQIANVNRKMEYLDQVDAYMEGSK